MSVIEKLQELSLRIPMIRGQLQTEEASKNALVMPFINCLGYNVFDPHEVVPEFTADVGIKKGEKVDYAILHEGKPAILFECKTAGTNLETAHASQLYRYFSVTDARFGILTDGITYRFFSDLDEPNRMDSKPFLEFDMMAFNGQLASDVAKFSKDDYNIDSILESARDLKYLKGIKRSLQDEWANPSEEMVKLMVSRIYDGRFTQSVKEQFTIIARKAFHEFITERVNQRLRTALEQEGGALVTTAVPDEPSELSNEDTQRDSVVTTEEEMEGFFIVKAIVREVVDSKRVFMRDTQSYCGILLDDNNRKPICRLYFNAASKKHLGLPDENKNFDRVEISSLDDIYKFADRLKESAERYSG